MRMLKAALPFVLCATALAQQSTPVHPAPTHTGAWWNSKSHVFQEAFVIGYKSGTHHTAGKLLDVNRFPDSELVDGLDHFYHDFRNRSILVDDALNYVIEEMRGVPDEKLKTELEHMRASAAPPPNED